MIGRVQSRSSLFCFTIVSFRAQSHPPVHMVYGDSVYILPTALNSSSVMEMFFFLFLDTLLPKGEILLWQCLPHTDLTCATPRFVYCFA